jgi:hypothetical protein
MLFLLIVLPGFLVGGYIADSRVIRRGITADEFVVIYGGAGGMLVGLAIFGLVLRKMTIGCFGKGVLGRPSAEAMDDPSARPLRQRKTKLLLLSAAIIALVVYYIYQAKPTMATVNNAAFNNSRHYCGGTYTFTGTVSHSDGVYIYRLNDGTDDLLIWL